MQVPDGKKLDQIIVMLADIVATFGDRFDKIDGGLAKHDQRFDTLDGLLLPLENKVTQVSIGASTRKRCVATSSSCRGASTI